MRTRHRVDDRHDQAAKNGKAWTQSSTAQSARRLEAASLPGDGDAAADQGECRSAFPRAPRPRARMMAGALSIFGVRWNGRLLVNIPRQTALATA